MRRPFAQACALILVALSALGTTPVAAQSDATGRFLLLSDIHFDPFADPSLFPRLVTEPVSAWAGIFEATRPAGLNPRGTDSNALLLESSLDDARRRIPNPDFVLYPGDFLAHQWQAKYDALAPRSHLEDPEAYRAFTTKVVRFLAESFRSRYPDTPILPTLGNDDSYCGDYMIGPDGPFLAMFAEVWQPLLGARVDAEAFRRTFSRGGYYAMPLPGITKCRLIVLNSVVFSVSYDNACGSSTQTPALDQLRWLARTLAEARERDEKVWLLMHVPPGINGYNSVEDVAKGDAPVTFWQPELTARFLQLVRRYRDTLHAGFAGHTHMDDFRVVRIEDEPLLAIKIAPAISPIFSNNPGYQVYEYDRESGTIRDYRTFRLTNLPEKGQSPRAAAGEWAFEYAFGESYGAHVFDASTVAQLAENLAVNVQLQHRYTTYYGVSAPPEFDARTFPVYRCAIANMTPGAFLTCFQGTPKPRAPHPHPDRRARSALVGTP